MAEFKVNVPVIQANPLVTVDVSRENPLPLGANRFQLVVVDDAGNPSEPTVIEVIVRDTDKPTAILDVVTREGRIVEPVVSAGAAFILSAARSSDVAPGKIKEYRFTLLDRT
jgi:hypothetical protein